MDSWGKEDLWMSNGIAFAGATLVTVLLALGAGLVARAGGQSGDNTAPGQADVRADQDDLMGATGDPIVCQDGQVLQTSFAQSGGVSMILASIESHDAGHLTVVGPGRDEIDLLTDADIESEFLDGDAVRIEATADDGGNLVVTSIEPACPDIEAVEVVTDPAVPDPEPLPVEPVQTALPTSDSTIDIDLLFQLLIDKLDDDHGDDDDDDKDDDDGHDDDERRHSNHGTGGPHGD
jgi:hypothetical protein